METLNLWMLSFCGAVILWAAIITGMEHLNSKHGVWYGECDLRTMPKGLLDTQRIKWLKDNCNIKTVSLANEILIGFDKATKNQWTKQYQDKLKADEKAKPNPPASEPKKEEPKAQTEKEPVRLDEA